MNKTTPRGRAKRSRSSAQTTDPVADELRRYDNPYGQKIHRHVYRVVYDVFDGL